MKKILIPAVVLLIIGVLSIYGLYNKPHRNVAGENGIVTSAEQIFNDFQSNEAEANLKYLDKVVEVTGKVADVTRNQEGKMVVILDTGDVFGGVACTMAEEEQYMTGQVVAIKGICKGYLTDVVLTEAIKLKPNTSE